MTLAPAAWLLLQVSDSVWEECDTTSSSYASAATAVTSAATPLRYTVDGEECQFPATTPTGTTQYDCTALQSGGSAVCQARPDFFCVCGGGSTTRVLFSGYLSFCMASAHWVGTVRL